MPPPSRDARSALPRCDRAIASRAEHATAPRKPPCQGYWRGLDTDRDCWRCIDAMYGPMKPPDQRRHQREARSRPLVSALKAWAETIFPQLSGASDLALAFRYMLARWTMLTRVFDDGRIALDNNPAEKALRSVAVGCKN